MHTSSASHLPVSAAQAFFSCARPAFSLNPQGFRFAGWELRLRTRSLISATGHEVGLTKSEFALLLALLKRPKQIMSREQIMDMTQAEDTVFDRAIDVQMLRLRRKVETSGRSPTLLKTKRGAGYFLDADVQVLR
ncbi:winged helix-turn-helix domain-containing protein [Comamonas testosteroni]|uniref:Putative two component transcriptional regulator, winged helix family n=1 Tax=Comamonas testosteroni (strain DSM 14576 / KF-1) TaxID=399795 RepID=B7WR30_COMTK|nr:MULTISPECIES: winged helix-turn-helix domain-containing protein [Comamonas]EED65187.1 putative two component transcriptional regulator, winged helix family [Comamonas testosteroni KF-1]TYK70823.1 transcriptional regulator [Comamonas sp. Z3]WQG68599.1 winged helix-turn-helix domain-containing protein [Comamonas testosteroni]